MAETTPYYFEYDARNRLLAARFTGKLTDEILEEFYAIAPEYARALDLAAGIVDLSDVTSFEVSPETIRSLAALAPIIADPVQRYVIAPQDAVFGSARMFQLSGEDTRKALHVVRSSAEVLEAMDVDEMVFERLPSRAGAG